MCEFSAYGFYRVEEFPYYYSFIIFTLSFTKCYFCNNQDDHVGLFLLSNNVIYCIG